MATVDELYKQAMDIKAQIPGLTQQTQNNTQVSAIKVPTSSSVSSQTTAQTPQYSNQSVASNPVQFWDIINTITNKANENDKLVGVRQKLFTALYDRPLNDTETANLDPDLQSLLKGDPNMVKSQIEMEIRLLNDKISGRQNTLDQSIKYLTDSYQASIKDAESQRQQALQNVLQNVQIYGGSNLKSLYSQDQIDALKAQGIDIDAMSQSTLAEQKIENTTSADTIETSDGIYQWNSNTQRYDIFVGKGKGTTTTATGELDQTGASVVSSVNELLSSGLGGISGLWQTGWIPGTQASANEAKLKQLINTLALNARSLLKGSGAISDKETQMLQDSVTTLGKIGLSAKAMEAELKKVSGIVRANAGQSVSVQIKKDGKVVDEGLLGRDAIFDALSQGYEVIYQ
jgi:hypothetical protein